MSIPDIIETFESGRVLPPGDATEEEIFQAIRVEAERAMLAAGSPPDHPLDDRIGRVVARRIWLRAHPEEPQPELPVEKEIEEAIVIEGTMPEEEWRVAAKCQNYEVSSLGRVRRCTRGPGTYPGKILSAPPDTHGYRQFQTGPARARLTFLLHSLVAEKPGLYRLLARLHGVSDETARFAITGRNWESVTDSYGKGQF